MMTSTKSDKSMNDKLTRYFQTAAITESKPSQKRGATVAKALAEAVILQAIEDMWCEKDKSKRLSFFTGEGFRIYAKMAGMDFRDWIELLNLVKNASNKIQRISESSSGRRVKKRNVSEDAEAQQTITI